MSAEYVADIVIAFIAIVVPLYTLWRVNRSENLIRQDKITKDKRDQDEAETEARFMPYKQEIAELHCKVADLERALKLANDGVNELKDKRIAVLEARIVTLETEIAVLKKRRVA